MEIRGDFKLHGRFAFVACIIFLLESIAPKKSSVGKVADEMKLGLSGL